MPEDLVFMLLRELRGKIDGVDKRFDIIDKRLGDMDRRFDDLREEHSEMRTWVQFAIGQGMTNQLESTELAARIASLEKLAAQVPPRG